MSIRITSKTDNVELELLSGSIEEVEDEEDLSGLEAKQTFYFFNFFLKENFILELPFKVFFLNFLVVDVKVHLVSINFTNGFKFVFY